MIMNNIFHAENFHGKSQSDNFFEGWYFKQAVGDKVLSIIPGVSIDNNKTHAFIQIIASWIDETLYVPFDYSEFYFSDRPFQIRIGGNCFSMTGADIDIQHGGHSFVGKLNYTQMIHLEKSVISPNIMGPFSYLPKMECNHEIISLGHDVWGSITIDGIEMNFNMGRGYIEKNWGRSFPKQWIWMQANSFGKDKNCCVMAATANIPYAKKEVSGLLAILYLNGRQERFATYNGSHVMHIEYENHRLGMWIKKGKRVLEVSTTINKGGNLMAPKNGVMSRTIHECISGDAYVCLSENNHLLYEDFSPNAGVEIVNNK